jgi:hypothetical protein
MTNVELSGIHTLTKEVVTNIDVFDLVGTFMVQSDMDNTLVVSENDRRFGLRNV